MESFMIGTVIGSWGYTLARGLLGKPFQEHAYISVGLSLLVVAGIIITRSF